MLSQVNDGSMAPTIGYCAAMSAPHNETSLEDDELATWAAFATLLEWLPARLDAQLTADAGLTHFEYGVLYALRSADDHRLRMSTLAGYSNSTLSRLSRAATRLETKGWMRREPDPADGRYTLGILTAAGARKVDEAEPGHTAMVRHVVFDSLTRTQARHLREISSRVLTALGPESGWQPPRA